MGGEVQHSLCLFDAALGAKDRLKSLSCGRGRRVIFERVCNIVGLEEYLIVCAVDRIVTVVMSDQKNDAL